MMYFYKDLEMTQPAKDGDRVAVVVDDGTVLKQANEAHRPTLNVDGSLLFEGEPYWEGKKPT